MTHGINALTAGELNKALISGTLIASYRVRLCFCDTQASNENSRVDTNRVDLVDVEFSHALKAVILHFRGIVGVQHAQTPSNS